ncbi:protein PFC0760c-like [Teleopsis dalmanni]|uniref:protein PFC0760c-like n=1 Tax=Teleopsis dalmanni TaxID=139649 RepID=UPI0018CED2FE|nr:protein PFC0760c-like [Teleopsis dalmanni]XP_037948477.1 protein PFC0760c-like [Teleopsis dalmanni]
MNSNAWKRLQFEYENWHLTNLPNITANPIRKADESFNFFAWECVINADKSTGFEIDQFQILLTFNKKYPNLPPKCVFKLPIFHPNVTITGEIWSNLLRNKKGRIPPLTVEDILSDIQHIIFNPEVHNIANIDPGYLYLSNKDTYWDVVKKYGFTLTNKHQEYLQTLIKQECDDVSRYSNLKNNEEAENNLEDYDYKVENKNEDDDGSYQDENDNLYKNVTEEESDEAQNMENNGFVSNFSDNDNQDIFFNKMESMLNDLEKFIDNKLDAYLTEFRIYAREINGRRDEKSMRLCADQDNPNFDLIENKDVNKIQSHLLQPSQHSIVFDECNIKLTEIQDILQNLQLPESSLYLEQKQEHEQLYTSTDSTDSSNSNDYYVPMPSHVKSIFQTQDNIDKVDKLMTKQGGKNTDRTVINDREKEKREELNVIKSSEDKHVSQSNNETKTIFNTINANQSLMGEDGLRDLRKSMTDVSNELVGTSLNTVNIDDKEKENAENKVYSEINNVDLDNKEIKDVNGNMEEEKEPLVLYAFDDDEHNFQYDNKKKESKLSEEWIWKL